MHQYRRAGWVSNLLQKTAEQARAAAGDAMPRTRAIIAGRAGAAICLKGEAQRSSVSRGLECH
jgi:hypothetical protein